MSISTGMISVRFIHKCKYFSVHFIPCHIKSGLYTYFIPSKEMWNILKKHWTNPEINHEIRKHFLDDVINQV